MDSIEGKVLKDLGAGYTKDMVQCYVDCDFTSRGRQAGGGRRGKGEAAADLGGAADFLLPYAQRVWQENKDNCPVL